jgi:hypothetical protein
MEFPSCIFTVCSLSVYLHVCVLLCSKYFFEVVVSRLCYLFCHFVISLIVWELPVGVVVVVAEND